MKIRITGSGTQEELRSALERVLDSLTLDIKDILPVEWEDHILLTKIEEEDEEDL